MVKSVLILGSAPDAIRAREFDVSRYDAIIAINNAWRIRDDWTHLIYPDDFPDEKRTPAGSGQFHVTSAEFVPANNAYGGVVYAGGTMAFTASYWALHFFRPDVLAILGCDMVYDDEETHFYGTGEPDPLRRDPTLQSLEGKSARLMLLAAQQGCLCINHSNQKKSRLVWPRISATELAKLGANEVAAQLNYISEHQINRTIEYIKKQEEELGAFVESGLYWESPNLPNPDKLSQIDSLWLSACEKARTRLC